MEFTKFPGFYVRGRYLYDHEGEKVTLIGANALLMYWDAEGELTYPNLARTGANVCRFFWNVDDSIPVSKFDKSIENCIKCGLIPVPGLWNATGKWSNLGMCGDWWLRDDVKAVVKRYEKYLIVNIANEAGDGSESKEEWKNAYRDIIRRMRTAGIHTALLIDTGGWGRDESYMLECGRELVECDPDHNLLFGWHPYDPNQPVSRYEKAMDKAIEENICIIIGEFADHELPQRPLPVDWRGLVEAANKRDIGWLPWVWKGVGNELSMEISKDFTAENLTEWGRNVVSYIQKTAIKPGMFSTDK